MNEWAIVGSIVIVRNWAVDQEIDEEFPINGIW